MSTTDDGSSSTTKLAASSTTDLQFPFFTYKLDRANYNIWRANVLDTLDAFYLKDLVLSNSPLEKTITTPASGDAPATTTPNPEYALWKKRDKFTLVWIRTTISSALLGYIVRSETSFQAWTTIERMFQAQSRARSMHLKQELHSLTKGNLNILEYFEKKRGFADSFADCLQLVSDEDFFADVVHDLDSSYGPFKAAMNLHSDTFPPDDLLGALLREEECLQDESRSLGMNQPKRARFIGIHDPLWYTSVLVLIAEYSDDAIVEISAFSICLNLKLWEFIIALSLLIGACVRVSNELGRGNAETAKFTIKLLLCMAAALGIFFCLIVVIFGHSYPYLFTSDDAVAKAAGNLSVLLTITMLINSFQAVFSGVAIGCGLQAKVAVVNVISYYLIGVPIGCVFAFVADLGVKGLWIGMLIGMVVQVIALVVLTWRIDWKEEVNKTKRRLGEFYHESPEGSNRSSDHA